jgi:hypothetical protein
MKIAANPRLPILPRNGEGGLAQPARMIFPFQDRPFRRPSGATFPVPGKDKTGFRPIYPNAIALAARASWLFLITVLQRLFSMEQVPRIRAIASG